MEQASNIEIPKNLRQSTNSKAKNKVKDLDPLNNVMDFFMGDASGDDSDSSPYQKRDRLKEKKLVPLISRDGP